MQVNLRSFSDIVSVGMSILCAIHCFGLPLAIAILPGGLLLPVGDESMHTLFFLITLVVSPYAIAAGYSVHKNWLVAATGLSGLVVLAGSVILGHDVLGESLEKVLTLVGGICVSSSHIANFILCRKSGSCSHS